MKADDKGYIYVDVALPVALFMTFTYKIPVSYINQLENKELIGRRVLVPFRSLGLTGIITGFAQNKDLKSIREIYQIPDKKPVWSEDYIQILKNISEYYVSPIGITTYYAMPEGLRWKLNRKTGNWIKGISEEKIYRPAVVTLSDIPRLSEKARKLLEFILEKGEVDKNQIKEAGFSLNTLKTLIKKGLIQEERFIFREEKSVKQPEIKYQSINLKSGIYLYKNQIAQNRLKQYIKLGLSAIKNGESLLIILPNIATIQKIYPEFKKIFGERIFVYHDAIPEKEKIKIWFSLKETSKKIVLGTYSALFIPIKNLKTLIIEEEYSQAYKADRSPRFDARRVAFEIFKVKKDIFLIYASTVPSVESIYMLYTKKAKSLSRKDIFKDFNKKPEITLKGFSYKELKKELTKVIKPEEKNLIIVNRKGYASFLYCPVCEEEIKCERCDIPLKIHSTAEQKYLQCEICEKKYPYIKTCPECEHKLEEIGFGIEKVEKILREKFGDNVSIDPEKNASITITTSVNSRDFIFGIYDRVINIYPDFFLNIPDFRGEESFFRSIALPYFKASSKYIIFTNHPEHIAFQSLDKRDFSIFYRYELENRKLTGMPPYSKLILLTFEKKGLELDKVKQIFQEWIKKEKISSIEYEGPFFAIFSKVREKNRFQILLRNFKEKEKLKELYNLCGKKSIKLIIDVDPRQTY
ncbi:hypothetical protein [Persephonella sp. IF05-L8]|uniref:primosomal protein N' family DNA-binding protein n=1 Tax=Persephonella sp. IF05-L8 TaxID=1158338 RepID=UPI000497EFCA